VAAAFKAHYPGAHGVYVSYCGAHSGAALIGRTLLIPPQPADIGEGRRHWVACLFTSVGYGKAVDPPEKVLANTASALEDLREQVRALEAAAAAAAAAARETLSVLSLPREWHSAMINSVRFKVPWEETVAVIERVLEGSGKEIVVYEYNRAAGGSGRTREGGRGGRSGKRRQVKQRKNGGSRQASGKMS
jgi:ADP-ribose 1''-phosphate phosphatase